MELAGHLFGGGGAKVVQSCAHGGDLFGQGFRPWGLVSGLRGANVHRGLLAFGDSAACGALIIGSQPAEMAEREVRSTAYPHESRALPSVQGPLRVRPGQFSVAIDTGSYFPVGGPHQWGHSSISYLAV